MKVRRQLPMDFVQVDLLHSFQESLVLVKVELYSGPISASVQPTLLFISRLAIYRYLSGINILSLKHRHEIITSLLLQYTFTERMLKDYLYSTDIKYTVPFWSRRVWGGFVS